MFEIEISPQVVQLLEAGFGLLFLLAIMFLLALAKSALKPFETMTKFIQQSQQALHEGQRDTDRVIERNTDTLDLINTGIHKLIDRVVTSDGEVTRGLQSVLLAQQRLSEDHVTGVIINDEDMRVVLYSPSALEILGWGIKDLPTERDDVTPPMMTAASEPLTPDRWPAATALATGEPCKNVPLQIYNEKTRGFRWVLVSAYPCHECLNDGSKWVTVILRRLESLGRV